MTTSSSGESKLDSQTSRNAGSRSSAPTHRRWETACDRLASGEHVGSTVIRTFIEREQPDLVLCGHIHESRGTDTIGATQVINPGPASAGHYALVEVNDQVSVRLDG